MADEKNICHFDCKNKAERKQKMTMEEASRRYEIPVEILQEYERWGLCSEVKKVMGSWQYDDSDLEKLGMIMTLHRIGFSAGEVESYMRLLEKKGTEEERLRMLSARRTETLDEIQSGLSAMSDPKCQRKSD